jgi:hypothetical protein
VLEADEGLKAWMLDTKNPLRNVEQLSRRSDRKEKRWGGRDLQVRLLAGLDEHVYFIAFNLHFVQHRVVLGLDLSSEKIINTMYLDPTHVLYMDVFGLERLQGALALHQ